MRKRKLTQLEELTIIRASYQRVLGTVDLDAAAYNYPLKCGYRSSYGYAICIMEIIDKYEGLIQRSLDEEKDRATLH